MAQQDGKYLIVKDPNKPILRLYDIPDNTFESEDEEEESEEGEDIVSWCYVVFIVYKNLGGLNLSVFVSSICDEVEWSSQYYFLYIIEKRIGLCFVWI